MASDLTVRPATEGDPPCSCGKAAVTVILTDHGDVSCCHVVTSGPARRDAAGSR